LFLATFLFWLVFPADTQECLKQIPLTGMYILPQLSQNIINLSGEDPGWTETPTPAKRILTPFKKTGALEQKDEKHWQETNRGHKVVKHISKFKKGKMQILPPHSRETDSTDSDNEIDHDSDMNGNTIDNSSTN